MEPTNTADRSKAFWNFFLLLILSIAIITITIFSSVRIPFKQNEQLRKDFTVVEKEHEFSSTFNSRLTRINILFDSMKSSTQPVLLQSTITAEMAGLQQLIPDSIYNKELYHSVLSTLQRLSEISVTYYSQAKENTNQDALKGENATLTGQLKTANDTITSLRNQLSILRGH